MSSPHPASGPPVLGARQPQGGGGCCPHPLLLPEHRGAGTARSITQHGGPSAALPGPHLGHPSGGMCTAG